MAKEVIVNVKITAQQAKKNIEELNKSLNASESLIDDLEDELVVLNKTLEKQAGVTDKALNARVKTNKEIEKTTNKIQKEKRAIKDITKERQKNNKIITESTKQTADYSGVIGILDRQTGGAISGITGITGSVGKATGGFKLLRVAIIGTGIGALVIAIASLTAAFTSSEEGQNKLSKVFAILGSITGNLVTVFSDLGMALIDAFKNPEKAWNSFKESLSNGYNFIKTQIIDRFQGGWAILSGNIQAGILKMRIAWNNFTGDSEEADQLTEQLEEVKQKVKEGEEAIERANNAIVELYDDAANSVKGFVKELNEEAKIAGQIADKRAKADKLERKLLIDRAEATRKFNELREKAADKENVSIEDRIAALKEAGRIEEEITLKEIRAARLRFEAKKQQNELSNSTKQDLDEQATLEARLIELEASRLKKQKTLTAEITTNLREAESERKRIEAEKRAEEKAAQAEKDAEEKERKAQEAQAEKELADLKKQIRDAQAVSEDEKRALEIEKVTAHYDNLIALAKANDIDITNLEKAKAKKLEGFNKKIADDEVKVTKLTQEQKLAIISGALGGLAKLAGENSKFGKGIAVAQAVIDTFAGANKALAQGGIFGAVAAAGVIASGLANVKTILSTKTPDAPSGTGAGGRSFSSGGAVPQAPSFNIVGSDTSNQLAQTLATQTQKPVKAFVVSGDVTTAQSLDRNIIQESSLG